MRTVCCGHVHTENAAGYCGDCPEQRIGKNMTDITGRKFGRLIVTGYAGRSKNRQSRWVCKCECGKSKVIVRSSLTSGHSKSCGCLFRKSGGDATTRKGAKRCVEYSAWRGMINRCTLKSDAHWHDYGGRGITICKRWRDSYPTFLAYIGRKPSATHSLDRIDVNGNYEPGNVRWATSTVQHANRRQVQRRNWREAAKHAYRVVKSFEDVLASYTGAKFAITCDSCTDALLLAVAYANKTLGGVPSVEIPKHTYVGVPMSIINAGSRVTFRDEKWSGMYRLEPLNIYDCARWLTSGMYIPGSVMCLSFHWSKHLPIGRGGAILCDDRHAAEWFKRARCDGRKEGVSPKNDPGLILGYHTYMTPDRAATGLMLMAAIKEHNEPLAWDPYPDLSTMEIFR